MFSQPTLIVIQCVISNHHATLLLDLDIFIIHIITPKTFSSYFILKNLPLNLLDHVFAMHPERDTPFQLTPPCHIMTGHLAPFSSFLGHFPDILSKIKLWIQWFLFPKPTFSDTPSQFTPPCHTFTGHLSLSNTPHHSWAFPYIFLLKIMF